MSKRGAAARKKFQARPRRRRLRVLALLLVTAVLGAGMGLARWGMFSAAPAPPAQRRPTSTPTPQPRQIISSGLSPRNPAKEYIYAGGRLIATEEPSAPSKSDQTITFAQPPDRTYGDAPFALAATSSSGLPVSFTVTSGPASVSGDTVTLSGAGAVSIRADQAGNATFNPAPSVTRTFTVAKATPVITWQTPADIPEGRALGSAQLNATASVPGTFAYSPPAGTVLPAGNHTLSVAFTPTDAANYQGAAASVSINVVGCPQVSTAYVTAVSPVAAGTASRLSWNVPNALSVTVSGVAGTFWPVGQANVYPTATTTYELTAVGASVCPALTLQRTVVVEPCPTEAETTFGADTYLVNPGQSVQLSWSAPYATDMSIGVPCTPSWPCLPELASHEFYWGYTTAGGITVNPEVPTTYILSARRSGVSGCSVARKYVTIEVNPPPGECSPGAYFGFGQPIGDSIDVEGYLTLEWSVPYSANLTITDDKGASYGTFGPSGQIYVWASETTTYTLTAPIPHNPPCSPVVFMLTYQCASCSPTY